MDSPFINPVLRLLLETALILSGGITEAVSVQAGDFVTLRGQGMGKTSMRFV